MSFCFKMSSGEINERQANCCPAIDLSSSNKSIYLAFTVPSGLCLGSIPDGGA